MNCTTSKIEPSSSNSTSLKPARPTLKLSDGLDNFPIDPNASVPHGILPAPKDPKSFIQKPAKDRKLVKLPPCPIRIPIKIAAPKPQPKTKSTSSFIDNLLGAQNIMLSGSRQTIVSSNGTLTTKSPVKKYHWQ